MMPTRSSLICLAKLDGLSPATGLLRRDRNPQRLDALFRSDPRRGTADDARKEIAQFSCKGIITVPRKPRIGQARRRSSRTGVLVAELHGQWQRLVRVIGDQSGRSGDLDPGPASGSHLGPVSYTHLTLPTNREV